MKKAVLIALLSGLFLAAGAGANDTLADNKSADLPGCDEDRWINCPQPWTPRWHMPEITDWVYDRGVLLDSDPDTRTVIADRLTSLHGIPAILEARSDRQHLLFGTGESRLTDAHIDALIAPIDAAPTGARVFVIAHGDAQGELGAIRSVNQARASAVAEWVSDQRPDLRLITDAGLIWPSAHGRGDMPEARRVDVLVVPR